MNCEKIRQVLSAEIDGEAADHELPAAYRHLADCADCRQWRREFLQIAGNFPAWADQPIPAEVTNRLQEHIRKTGTAPQRRDRTVYRIPRPLAWVAVAILVLQIGWSSYRLVSPAVSPNGEAETAIPDTVVLTARDRVSTTMVVHHPEANEDKR